MKTIVLAAILALACVQSRAADVFSRLPDPAGGLVTSSWLDPEGYDADVYSYDSFLVTTTASISQVKWRGGYINGGSFGLIFNFTVTFFDSIPGGSEPLLGNPQLEDTVPTYLVKRWVGGTANETPAGTFGGIPMYDYSYNLPTPFEAQANHKYWLRIQASQPSVPDWGVARGTGGDSQHYQFNTGSAQFHFYPGDTAFTLAGTFVPVALSGFSLE